MVSAQRSGTRRIGAIMSAVVAVSFAPALIAAGPVAYATVSTPTLTWSGPIPLIHNGLSAFPNAVACPSAAQCTLVDNEGQEVTFDPATPASATSYVFDSGQSYLAIACPATTECVAVANNGREIAFNPAAPAGATPRVLLATALRAVVCPTTTQCTAVDSTGHELTFNPTTTDAPTNVTVDSGKQLNGIACPTSSQCTAVDNSGNEVTFIPTSPGSPTPAAIDGSTAMNGVSCPSTTQCTAVDSSGQVVTFNPTSPGTPTPVSIDSGQILTDIMCPSASRCVTIDFAHHEYAFDPTNVGTPTQNTIGATFLLTSLDCPSTTQCTFVDNGGRTATVDPTAPGSPTLVLIDGRATMIGVSCPAATQCTAIDNATRTVTFDPTTGVVSTPATAVITTGSLKGIACPSTTQCTTVDSNATEETFNPATPGTHTSVGMGNGGAAGVACPSTTLCVSIDTSGERSTFNPTNASPMALTVDFAQTTSALACPSTTQCTTVHYAGGFVTFGPNDNPSTTYAPTTIDSGQRLFGIACPSTTKCVAVDWIGQTVVFSPNFPSNPTVTLLDSGKVFNAVACASTTLCVAVDSANRVFEGDPAQPAGWNMQTLSQAVSMQSVSCPTATECVATDGLGNAFIGRALPVNTSLPSITGTKTQGQQLTAVDGSWTNSPTSFAYQWEDCDNAGANCTSIGGAIGSTYVLQGSDAGHTIRLIVTATNAVGTGQPATSAATSVVLPLPPGNVAPPTISGNPSQGQMLTEGAGTWSNNATGFTYQWQDCDSAGANCTAIGSATASTYTLQAGDVGHTIRVTETASNAGGSSSAVPSAQTAVISPPDTTAPTVQFDAEPANPTASRSAHFAFSATDSSPPVTFSCQLDSAPSSGCASPVDLSSLADGLHTFTVTATDAASNASSPLAYQWRVDGTAPTATLKTPTLPFVLSLTTPVTWSGADSGAGVASYQLRYQRAVWNNKFGPWTYPSAWQSLHGTSLSPSLSVGYTYCFSVRSVDAAGNLSAWTASKCTERPLDDRAGTVSTGWTRGTSSAYYLSTYTQTTGLNKTITITSAHLDRIGIVATKCVTCGTVAIYVGNTRIGTVSLYSKTTVRKAIVALPKFSLRTGNVTVKVLTSGKLVQLDGFAVSQA
ncbi:MAG: hypothetical protein QOG34_63 [Frankiaceae bacterium]|nr:hypothetical protein [Frankiaceae bacterium]